MLVARQHTIAGLTNPLHQRPGIAQAQQVNGQAFASQRPIVGVRIAADSQLDVCDLWRASGIVSARDRMRVSAESPWVGRLEPGDLFVSPVRAFDSGLSGATYPDRAVLDYPYPMLKLELFECHCRDECGGHPPPIPAAMAPLVLLGGETSVVGTRRYRLPMPGRDYATVALQLDGFAGGTTGVSITIEGIDYALDDTTVVEVTQSLVAVVDQPAGDYSYAYAGVSWDELRLTLTVVGDGGGDDAAGTFVKMEAKAS
jgi:hypothetical protein